MDNTTEGQRQTSVKQAVKGKIFNDPIHGTIEMHQACVCIIDTPQFQRLRHIKQLDTCSFVYPGANHTSVSYLAGKLLKTIRDHQKLEEITDREILCVEIAGLCHDLGRGPFSYVFEKMFMKQKRGNYKHRETARKMFKHMLKIDGGALKKKIQESISSYGIANFANFEKKDFTFIKEMIDQPLENLLTKDWRYKGRDEKFSYMYEIVNNTRNGIDVDKWDYLARDSYMLGVKTNFDYNRCFASARVLKSNGQQPDGSENSEVVPRNQICYRDKDAQGLYDMFYTKMLLTRQAYQHKTNAEIRLMMLDVLNFANDCIEFNGKKLSDTVDDMEAFTKLTDDLILFILYPPSTIQLTKPSNEQGLENARTVMNRILKRDLYKFVGQTQTKEKEIGEVSCKEAIMKNCDDHSIDENLFHTYVVNLHYGENESDPLRKVRFYRKNDVNLAIKLEKEQISYVLPATFAEKILRIYSKVPHSDPMFRKISCAFRKWCEFKRLPLPKDISEENENDTQHQEDPTNKPLAEPSLVQVNTDQQESLDEQGIGGFELRENTVAKETN